MAEEAGAFAFADVARAICDKMLRRHPHVFGDQKVAGSAEQTKRWEEIKREERGAPRRAPACSTTCRSALPALTRAAKLGKRAATVGFDWPDVAGVRAKVDEEIAELDAAAGAAATATSDRGRDGRPAVHGRELVPASRARSRDVPARRERAVRDALPRRRGRRSRATAATGRARRGRARRACGRRAEAVDVLKAAPCRSRRARSTIVDCARRALIRAAPALFRHSGSIQRHAPNLRSKVPRGIAGKRRAAMLANKFLAVAVLGFLGASAALADHDDRGRGRGNAYGHYRYAPAVVSARVVDVEPMVRYVTVDRPREQCWDEIVREPVRPLRCGWPDGCRQHRRRRDRPAVRQRQRPRHADGARRGGRRRRRASTRRRQRRAMRRATSPCSAARSSTTA